MAPTNPFLPITTARCVVRPFRADDAPTVAAYRNEPEVARYQDWELPFTGEQAQRLVADESARTGLEAGTWVQLAVEHAGRLAGDVGVRLDEAGTNATIGFTLARDAQGKGLATEAVGSVIDRLFELGVHRVVATIDPENLASARLLGNLGFRHEARLRSAVRVRGEWVDDDLYALLPLDRDAWLNRPSAPPDELRLVEITDELVRPVARLETHHWQHRFVAPMHASFLDALFPEEIDAAWPDKSGTMVRAVPWLRAVVADGTVAGFVMVAAPAADGAPPYLWRLLVDRFHQRRGVGQLAVRAVMDELRRWGCTELYTSWVPGFGTPEPFYRRLGFEPTGLVEDGEIVGRVPLG
jgi:RimJ/RimL family protein N-acetyltransferase